MAFVSVIIPCYKAQDFIHRCLEALEQQTYQDFEVILVDDASPDNTLAVLEEYRARSPLCVTVTANEVNAGPAASRNRGIAIATGTYVAFCDSDDYYQPDYLERMVAQSEGGQADMVLCNSRKVTGNNVFNITLFKDMPKTADATQVLALGIDSLCSLMVRREIAVEVPLPSLRNGEDMAVIPLMMMRCRRFGFVEECIYNYVCRPGSLSLSAHAGVTESLERSFDHILAHQLPGFRQEIEFIGIKNLVYGGLLNHFKVQKDPTAAWTLLDKFEQRYPHWYGNRSIGSLPLFKKSFLFFAKMRWSAPLRLMCFVHRVITEKE